MLPGPRIFRSRWAALAFAGGVIWTAVDVAQSAPQRAGPAHGTVIRAGDTDVRIDLAPAAEAMR